MGAVTVDASALNRGMHEFFLREFFRLFRMAAETDIVAFCHQEIRELALMSGMT